MKNTTGKKQYVTQILPIIFSIAIDIWWAVSFGFDYIFWAFVAITIALIVWTAITLKKSISVDNRGVIINGTAIPYSNIASADASKRGHVAVTTNDSKEYKIPVGNDQEVCDAIIANTALFNNAQSQQ